MTHRPSGRHPASPRAAVLGALFLGLVASSCARHSGANIVSDPLPPQPPSQPPTEPIPRQSNSDAALIDLTISAGPVDQTFEPDIVDYTATVPFVAFETTVTAVPRAAGATIEIRGVEVPASTPSAPIALPLGETLIAVHVTSPDGTTGRAYLIEVTRSAPDLTGQMRYIKATNTNSSDRFGTTAAIDGDTLVVGAPYEDSSSANAQGDNGAANSGAVYVYVRNQGEWTIQAYLKAHNLGAGDRFGSAVALRGDTLLVGAPGEDSAARGALGNGQGQGFDDLCGESGAAYVFTRTGSTWTQTGYLKGLASDIGDAFGTSVALAGHLAAVGLPGEDSSSSGVGANLWDNSCPDSGAAVVFRHDGATWQVDAFVKAPFSDSGDAFGTALALRSDALGADTLAVGAPGDDGDSNQLADAGAVHFYRYSAAWTVGQTVRAAAGGVDDGFGSALALQREVLAVGAPREDSGAAGVGGSGAGNSHPDAGAVYLFSEVPSVWTQTALVKATNPGQGDLFGTCVSLDGDLLLVGAPIERSAAQGVNGNQNDESLYAAGAAYVYARVDGVWQAQNYIKSTNPDPSDLFGNAVALSGSTLVVATRKEDGAGTGLTGDPTDNNAPDSGAVFVLEMQ